MRNTFAGVPLEGFAECARIAATKGAVLLKNDNQVLPFKKEDRVSVFGRMQIDYYRSGTGSGGSVNVASYTNLLDGLRNSDGVIINEDLAAVYETWIEKHPFDKGNGLWASEPWNQTEMEVSEELVRNAANVSNKALIVIGRTAGEDKDNSCTEGSYLLTRTERRMIHTVTRYFKETVVALNVSNIIDMKWLEDKYVNPISSVIYLWQGGMESGNAAADVLSGKTTVEGKLADTIAYYPEDYPSDINYGGLEKNIYQEDIYIGYRYFETFCPSKVQFPFGFGLSYTEFEINIKRAECIDNRITVTVEVKNIGNLYAGREVIQIYCEAPQGKLGRPVKELVSFAKTSKLEPGNKEEITMDFDVNIMAAYDDIGLTGNRSCFVLEEGTYLIWVGNSVRNLQKVVINEQTGYIVDQLRVVEKLHEAAGPEESFSRIKPGRRNQDGSYELIYETVPARTSSLEKRIKENEPREIKQTGNKNVHLKQVNRDFSMDEFIAQLNDEELAAIVRGEGMCSPKVTPGTASAFGGVTDSLIDNYGIPVAASADGPSGIRMDDGAMATQLPIGTLLACSWDVQMVEMLYEMEGQELLRNEIDTLLGPGVNIHRHPFNGRNFEYFSEDPLLTGKFACAVVRGIAQSKAQATVKHLACNTQETNRHQVNAVVSERALREIYLKAFELAVKEGNAKSIMTAYNPVNGHWSASNYDILSTILRKEWGFDGIVMTDWWAAMNNTVTGGACSRTDTASMIKAQNDIYMVVNNYGAEENISGDNTLERLRDGWLKRGELQRSAKNICWFLLNAPVMHRTTEGLRSVMKIPAGIQGKLYDAGIYSIYVYMSLEGDERAQGSANVYINDYLVASAQTNGTNGRIIKKLLLKVELERGKYAPQFIEQKAGINIEKLEFVKEKDTDL